MGGFKDRVPLLDSIFSISGIMLLETLGNIGLVYYVFLLGLEMDLTAVQRMRRKPICIAIAGTIFPFGVGLALYYLLLRDFKKFYAGSFFWGVSLTVTGLPVVAIILAKLKLLYSDVGKTAMSSALVNELFSWTLLTIAMALASNKNAVYWTLLSTVAFVIFCVLAIRPAVIWMIHRTQKGDNYSETTICFILTGVLACGLATDVLGVNSMVGAFVFGLVIPNELLGHRFVQVLQGFVSDLLMPIYFTVSGVRTDLGSVMHASSLLVVAQVMGLACLSKFVTVLTVSLFCGMSFREGISLAVLMNTKGLLSIIAVNVGRDHLMLEDEESTVMLIAILVMTMGTVPIMSNLYKPARRFLPNKHRAIQRLKSNAELRILACVHEMHNVGGIINLLEASNATKRSPICVFALQLIQLTGHATTAMLIVQSVPKCDSQNSRSGAQTQSDQILAAFETFEKECTGVSVLPLNAMSSYTTMHEDICSIAEDKRVSIIIIPFHKRQTIHNKMEDTNPAYKDVNDNVLANAPCSVGILIDRGFGTFLKRNSEPATRHLAMIYIGGPDDREALSYAWRMSGHPMVTLTVVRFIPDEQALNARSDHFVEDNQEILNVMIDSESEKRIDDNYINEFRQHMAADESIVYLEKVVNNGVETIAAVRSMGGDFDLYVVGRGMKRFSSLTAGLADWSECPELGAIGDLLMSSDFSSTASVLVVQQYDRTGQAGDRGR
ncbi:hypothetical protein F0562_013773 [Nyssa sinensis]|uniref:Uncharacterized protein n=1 Tax=Nyssa sinensis TaxID=561372 RepID=A0A5J4ZQT1_9ASTE|nr:hypothetical protein F0562_013773 [Nyssa sinensis]